MTHTADVLLSIVGEKQVGAELLHNPLAVAVGVGETVEIS